MKLQKLSQNINWLHQAGSSFEHVQIQIILHMCQMHQISFSSPFMYMYSVVSNDSVNLCPTEPGYTLPLQTV